MTYAIRGARTSTIMRKIVEIFEANTHKTGRKKLFTARFMLDQLPGCTITITKARRYLGVEAKIIAGKHCWLPPKRTLQQALSILGDGSKASVFKVKQKREERKHAMMPVGKEALLVIGKEYNWCCTATQALTDLQTLTGYRSQVGIFEAKHDMNIKSERDEGTKGVWYWVWPSVEIQDWILERTEKAPVPFETLKKEAAQLGWNYRAVRYNLTLNLNLVVLQKYKGVMCWGRIPDDRD